MGAVRVAALQMSLKEGDTAGNWKRAKKLLREAGDGGANLAVLPEMWWTGFSYRRLPAFSEETGRSLKEVGKVARAAGMAVIGSWPEKDGERIYNTAYVVGPDGELRGSYRKIHLFGPMKENLFLAPGDTVTVVAMEIGRIGVALCYDLRFPELVRKMALAEADLIVFPSQWPAVRKEHFHTLLTARAVENQLFTVGANRTGRGGLIRFGGSSLIVGPGGEILARGELEEGVIMADLDFDEIAEVRREVCYLEDRVGEVDEFLKL